MFRQVKSALFWYYLYKFRKKVLIIAFLLIIAIFANAIYSDIVQYLTLKQKLQYLETALLIKWIIIVFNILFSIYLILTFFKSNEEEKEKKKEKKEKINDIMPEKQTSKSRNLKFTEREEKFLKKELKSKGDLLVER